jgi:hypothetical protein
VEQPHRRLDAGWLHHHPAVREERVPDLGADVQPEVPGALPRRQARQRVREERDPRELPQHHLLRSRRLRHRGGRQHLLRRAGQPADRPAGRGARRPRPQPLHLRPGGQPRGRPGPLGPGARRDGRRGLADRAGAAGLGVPAGDAPDRLQPGHPQRVAGPGRPARHRRAGGQGLRRAADPGRRPADHQHGGPALPGRRRRRRLRGHGRPAGEPARGAGVHRPGDRCRACLLRRSDRRR